MRSEDRESIQHAKYWQESDRKYGYDLSLNEDDYRNVKDGIEISSQNYILAIFMIIAIATIFYFLLKN